MPVVPFTPLNLRLSLADLRFSSSIRSSWSQRQALLPGGNNDYYPLPSPLSSPPHNHERLLTDSGQLGGLEVSEAECRHLPELISKGGQAGDDPGQLGQEDIEAVTEDDEVGVVPDIAGGGAQVDDGGG